MLLWAWPHWDPRGKPSNLGLQVSLPRASPLPATWMLHGAQHHCGSHCSVHMYEGAMGRGSFSGSILFLSQHGRGSSKLVTTLWQGAPSGFVVETFTQRDLLLPTCCTKGFPWTETGHAWRKAICSSGLSCGGCAEGWVGRGRMAGVSSDGFPPFPSSSL